MKAISPKKIFRLFVIMFFVFAVGNLIFMLEDLGDINQLNLGEVDFDFSRPEFDIDFDEADTKPRSEPLVSESEDSDGDELSADKIVEETNTRRRRNNLSTLEVDEKLERAAYLKAEDMFDREYFAHVSPTGEGVEDLIKEVEYDHIKVGENLAKGNFEDEAAVVDGWMDSIGHRENILTENFEEIGIAAEKSTYQGMDLWMIVQIFGRPSDACPEINKDLLEKIENKEMIIEDKSDRLDNLQKDIKKPEGNYFNKVEKYNELAEEYNKLVAEMEELVKQYNKQVEARNKCIEK